MLGVFIPSAAHAAELSLIPTEMFEVFTTGDFTWIDVINFLLHLIQMLLTLAGILAIILIMYGGFQYIFGAMSDDKDAGKNTIKYSLLGLAVTLSAWILVDITISLVTQEG